MRSEDRKPSKRVFPLLQNLDLDSLTFAQVQGVGDPITIEDMNEQEMVDLIIVNLARLVVAGEWDGLLEAGGETLTWQNTENYNAASGYGGKFWNIAAQSPICSNGSISTVNFNEDYQFYNPFIAPFTGAPAACNINVTVATTSQNLYVGFYSGTNGIPATMLGYATIATNSTGIQRVTSFTEASTGSLTFTAGSMFYYSVSKAGDQDPTVTIVPSSGALGQLFSDQAATVGSNRVLGVMSDTEITSAPADVAETDLWNGGTGWTYRVMVWLEK